MVLGVDVLEVDMVVVVVVVDVEAEVDELPTCRIVDCRVATHKTTYSDSHSLTFLT